MIFPHHENEIAQSEAAHDKNFANYWMHNGFINVDNEKMAKSTGNFFTVRDLAQRYPYEVLRYFMLTGHYRSPINFSDTLLEAASNAFERIKTCLKNLDFALTQEVPEKSAPTETAERLEALLSTARVDFAKAMADDLNTPDALAVIFALVYQANLLLAEGGATHEMLRETAAMLRELMEVLGFDLSVEEGIPAEIMAKVEARTAAKKARDFTLADALRAEVSALGYKIEDTAQGPQVSKI